MAEPPLLVLIRHGETVSNRLQRFAGWSDEHLTDEGRERVQALARRLGIRGGRLYTSPVRRAVETAEILAAELSLPVHTVHDLHEIDIGEWTGLTESEIRERWPEAYRTWQSSPDGLQVLGRESLPDVRRRALRAADQIGKAELSEEGTPALVVTHLAVIRVLWLAARHHPASAYHSVSGDPNRVYALFWEGPERLTPARDGPLSPEQLGSLLADDGDRG